jgi:hypothetical protein
MTNYWSPLKGRPKNFGHLCVMFPKKTERLIHVLVLEAFIGPCPPGLECRHLDGDPSNNALDNLRWGTHLENCVDRDRHGKHHKGARCSWAKLTEDQVREIRAKYVDRYGEQTRLAREYGVNPATIRTIVKGVNWRHLS